MILRWSDVYLDPSDPYLEFRGKDTQESGDDYSRLPVRQCPMFPDLNNKPVLLELMTKARQLNPDGEFVFNKIGSLSKKPEFPVFKEDGKVINDGRYRTNPGGHLTRAVEKAGLKMLPSGS